MAYPTFTAGRRLRASELAALIPPATVTGTDTSVADGTTTSTTFVSSLTTTGTRGVVFTAGASGKAEVAWACNGRNNTAGQSTVTSFEVRTGATIGSGTVVQASDENTACAMQSDSANQALAHAGSGVVTGLTPGATYNAYITYRATAGTATINRRKISVKGVG